MDDQNTTQFSNSDFQSTHDQRNIVNITDTRGDPLHGAGIDPNTGAITDGAKESFRGETSVGGTSVGNPGIISQGDAVDAGYTKEADTDTDDPGVNADYRDATGTAGNDADAQETGSQDSSRKNFENPSPDDIADYLVNE